MKKVKILLPVFGAIALAGGIASQTVLSKGHVPLNQVQVCHNGVTKMLKREALAGHIGHGDCQLPACDGANVFFAGDACPTATRDDGTCDVPNDRSQADTPACLPF